MKHSVAHIPVCQKSYLFMASYDMSSSNPEAAPRKMRHYPGGGMSDADSDVEDAGNRDAKDEKLLDANTE